ncbi:MAG: radical SAM protein [Chloroflexi bacterium]|nr:radical SAM protein [Chloroflexota bacterium]
MTSNATNNVCLVQVNYQYGNNVFLPHSVGLVQAYCQTIPQIQENFKFLDFVYLREDPDVVAKNLDNPKIIGISCYLWNWEWSKALAQRVKVHHPECLVVFGGPQVPSKPQNFFQDHSYVDLLVHYEGETAFSEILLEFLKETPNYQAVQGVSVRLEGDRCSVPQFREQNPDLNAFPSPYLSGCFDYLLDQPYGFHATQETHRGCPYSCTFCDWGSAVFTKVRPYSDSRLEAELKWFGENEIELLYNCDANYGLLPRDLGLTKNLVATKQKMGFPKQFRAAYAKNSNMKVFEIGKLLNDADMSKGVTLSFQSMDENTLSVIKRNNIKVQNFEELVKLYHQNDIPTYTEIIMGLPGETHDSFVDGIEKLLDAGQHDGLNIYVCIVLLNAEMGDPAYIEKHGIRTIKTPALLQHSSSSQDPVTEYYDIVIETNSMSESDYKRVFVCAWVVQAFHSLGLTQYLAMYFHYQLDFSYKEFYLQLLEFSRANPDTLLGKEYTRTAEAVEKAVKGGHWGVVDPKFGDVIWPIEEATFLNVTCDKDAFYEEIGGFIRELVSANDWVIDESLLEQMLEYQKQMIIDPYAPESISLDQNYNFHEYFKAILFGDESKLEQRPCSLVITPENCFNGELETYAREVVWYGRKGGKFRHSDVTDANVVGT